MSEHMERIFQEHPASMRCPECQKDVVVCEHLRAISQADEDEIVAMRIALREIADLEVYWSCGQAKAIARRVLGEKE